jgi:hypothetical protein
MTKIIITGCIVFFFFLQEIGGYSNTLRQVTLKIISVSECNSALAIYGSVTDSMICAKHPNEYKGACPVRGL